MAIRLSKVLGRTAQSWLAMQAAHDLFFAEKNGNWKGFHRFAFPNVA
jgi:plasmid maintenance system antidote protein VapI